MTIRSINHLGLTICTVAPMLAISSCTRGVSNAASMLMAAPIILPMGVAATINTAEERANERRRERSIKAIKAKRTDGPFTELWPNGKKRVEGTYKNKELSGPYKEWHENGQIRGKANYIDGDAIGEFSLWFDNGQLHYTTYHKKEKLGWPDLMWYKNGLKRFERTVPNSMQQHKETWLK